MAPEQAESQGAPVTAAADLYALGLIAFRMLVGRSYWRPGSLAQMLAQILVEPMAPASERGSTLGPAFDAWFARACSRDPGKRFESAFDEVEALAGALGLPEEKRAPTPAPSRKPATATSTLESAPTVTPDAGGPVPTLGASSREMTTARTRRSRGRWPFVAAGAAVVAVAGFALYVPGGANKTAPSAAGVTPPPPRTATATATPIATATATPIEASVASATTAAAASTPTARPTSTPPPTPRPTASAAPAPSHRPDAGRDPLEGQY